MGESLVFESVKSFRGHLRPPSDKSLTHRALIFASLAKSGKESSVIHNPLLGEDCLRTQKILAQLGKPSLIENSTITMPSLGLISGKSFGLDCGNSGTTMRLLSGVFAGIEGLEVQLIGDESLSKRPMKRITDPLSQMGAQISGNFAPIHISGRKLHGISYNSPVASAQIKSAILLAGLNASSSVSVTEPEKSRDHTERMLMSLGVRLQGTDSLTVTLEPGQYWDPFEFYVPADISSAAFWMVAAALNSQSEIMLQQVGVNPTRSGILDVLEQVGVQVERSNEASELGEPTCNLTINAPQVLKPFEISGALVPRLIDEIPVLAVLATQCEGTTIIKDAAELRVKETDRIAVVGEALARMGADIEFQPDGMIITGPTPLSGAQIDSKGDHRIGMSFAIAASIAEGSTTILNADSIKTSYPSFVEDYKSLAQI